MYGLGLVPTTRAEFEAQAAKNAAAERQIVHSTLDVLEGKTPAQIKAEAAARVGGTKVKLPAPNTTPYALPDIAVNTFPWVLAIGLAAAGFLLLDGSRGSRKDW